MRSGSIGVAGVLVAALLAGCSGEDADPGTARKAPTASSGKPAPDPSRSAKPKQKPRLDPERAQRMLQRFRRSLVRANTGSYSIEVSDGSSGFHRAGSYQLDPPVGTSRTTLTGPDGAVLVDTATLGPDTWFRIFGLPERVGPTCWVHITNAQLAAFHEVSPNLQFGVEYAPLAAVTRVVDPVLVDAETMRVQANLYDVAASVSAPFVAALQIPLRTRERVEIEIDILYGEYSGWQAQLGDITRAAKKAGYIADGVVPAAFVEDETDRPVVPIVANASSGVVVVDLIGIGDNVRGAAPTGEIIELDPDDPGGFERALQRCTVR